MITNEFKYQNMNEKRFHLVQAPNYLQSIISPIPWGLRAFFFNLRGMLDLTSDLYVKRGKDEKNLTFNSVNEKNSI